MRINVLGQDGRIVSQDILVPEGGEIQITIGGRVLRIVEDADVDLLLQVAPSHGPIFTSFDRRSPNRLLVGLGR